MLASARHHSALRQHQQGVALVVTLVILTIVTILGVVAMRSGMLHIAIGTNAQVAMLNFQEADAGLTAVENTVRADPIGASRPSGILGMAPGFERVACLKKTGLVVPTTPTGVLPCDPEATGTAEYSSGRDAVLVQVTLLNPVNAAGESMTAVGFGTDTDVLPGGGNMLVRTLSTSVLPAFGGASTAVVKACLQTHPGDDTSDATVVTVTDCLATAGASFTTLVQEYSYGLSP